MIIKSKEAEELFDRGINYFRAGFYSSALYEFNKVKKLEPGYPNIDFVIEAALKKNSEVAGQLTSFIEENFDADLQQLSDELTVENSSDLGPEVQALLKRGCFNEALKKLRQVESVIPDSRPLLLLLGNTQRRLGMYADAEKTLQRAMHVYPEDSEILNNLGNVLLSMGLLKDAEETFRIALRISPDDPRILNNLGALKMQANDLDDAEHLFRKALKFRPSWATLKKNLFNLQRRIKALDEEIEKLRNEFFVHPSYLDIGLALGKSLFFRGYYSEARSVLRGVLKQNPGLLAAWFYLASSHEIAEDAEKALECYREMVVRSGKDTCSEFLNFEILMKQEFFDEALVELKKIAVLELDLASSRINLGVRYFEDCLWEDALRHFEVAVQINDTYPDAVYWVGMTLLQLKKLAKAKDCFARAVELNPDYADAHFQLGMLLRAKAKKKAIAHLEKALSLNLRPSFARIAEKILDEQK
ncbi:MAG: tetratricopeptide repeat protein [Erysipelotrichia bacterium]|nr:tetratricopeptide repeat protein [Erysipelotrichia bacterium]